MNPPYTEAQWRAITTLGRRVDERLQALDGCGVQASGMCPSPASSPEVGSKPIQPAPGR